MSRLVNRQKRSAARRNCRSMLVPRRASSPAKEACVRQKRERIDLAVAARARRAVQQRIVDAFGRHVRGAGAGPTNEDLQVFAKLAVAEQRLRRRLAPNRSSGEEVRREL
jgi:hypothetical protein